MKKIFLLLIIFLLVGCSTNNMEKAITYQEAQELINNGNTIIIDVRTSIEYDDYHIENAINIPLDTINKESLEKVVDSYYNNIIVYCRSGVRSKEAKMIITNLGYDNVYDLGSIDNWSDNNE